MPGEDTEKCLVCEEGKIQHPCKLCRAYLYCSKGCSKKDTKKHKQSCSNLALFLARKSRDGELTNDEELRLIQKHVWYMTSKIQANEDGRAESRASARSVLGGAGLTAKAKDNDQRAQQDVKDKISAAGKDYTAALKGHREALAAKAAANRLMAGARGGLAGAARETRNLKPESYGDSRYWEQRHAKSLEGGETYEWYTDYPEEALREAFPQSVRDKKMLVVGCGNSELSEKMCNDGFRDVLSIDTSESAIQQMSARAPRFNTAQTSCRYEVMDAGRLDALGAETFGGVVDKGTIDAVLSAGLKPASRICREAMRVLEPGGTLLVISSSPAAKLRSLLLRMCGPGSAADPPSIAVPVAGDACVYAHFVRKKGSGKGGDVSSAPGQAENPEQLGVSNGSGVSAAEARTAIPASSAPRSDSQVYLGSSNESGASGAEARTAIPACAAPRSDSQVSELEPPVEPGGKACGGEGRPRGGVASGLPFWEALHGRKRDDSLKEEGRAEETKRDQGEAGRSFHERFADISAALAKSERQFMPPAGREPLPSIPSEEEKSKILLELSERRAKIAKVLGRAGKSHLLGGGVSCEPPPPAVAACSRLPPEQGQQQPPPQQQQQQLQQLQTSQPVVPEQQPSLPWGSRDSFSEDAAGITYELKFDTELSSSKLSVEIGTSRIKVSDRRQPGDCEVLLDRELHDKVTAESTWCIEDKRNLCFILCKRTPDIWKRVFKSLMPEPPPVVRRGGTAQTNANGNGNGNGTRAVDSAPRQQELPAAAGDGPLRPVPSPPAVPRKHEQSPKAGLVAGHDFKTPERFLVEDHVGIKKLQLHLSKPQGFRVTSFQVSRAGPELCEVRFVCRDETGGGLPDARFLQRAHLGRADFSAELASCNGGAADGLCIVGVPYATGDRGEVERAGRSDADDEGVRRIARLRCRFCHHPFTAAGNDLAVRAMPSGRWDDCIEDMVCYDGPRVVPMLARDVNFARPGRCLMAQAEVLLHPLDVVRGAVAVVDGPAAATGGGEEVGMPAEPGEGLRWQSLECARCDLPVGRLAAVPDGQRGGSGGGGGVAVEEGRGLLLLKHCVLGDDVSEDAGGDDAGDDDAGSDDPEAARVETSTEREGSAPRPAGTVGVSRGPPPPPGPACPAPPCVFRSRTAIKWVMGEMSHFSERDGCARFILSARGRSTAAPRGALTLVLMKMDGLVSTSGGSKPCRAHRVAFREESREEAERRDEEERRDESSDSGAPPPPPKEGAADGGEEGTAAPRKMMKTGAKVPARVLDVSYAEYRAARERLLETAWAGASSEKLDPRGFAFSYLF